MKKSIIWIITISVLLFVAGIVLYSLVRSCELETREYEIKENFGDITIIANTADIQLILSEEPNSFVVCEEEKNVTHSVLVEENTLRIEVINNKKWYEHIGITISVPKITVYLGKSECGNISIETDTGNIMLDNITATGKIAAETDTGNVLLDNVITTGKLAIETDTGNVKFEACDASEAFIETDTGNVTGSFLTDKVIFTESKTGSIEIPKVIADEKCEIITDTGNIKITIEQKNS